MNRRLTAIALAVILLPGTVWAQSNPLWHEEKVKNYLPHMTWPEVRDLLTRTDMVLIPVPSLEQHGLHAPIGTDFFGGVERAKLIAQRTDILVAPILLVGQAPYHMEFPGTIALSAETMQQVYFEAAQSLIRHGCRRFVFFSSHTGNQHITRFVVDRINQETSAIAVDLSDGMETMTTATTSRSQVAPQPFDRHAGVAETSGALYLFPSLVALEKGKMRCRISVCRVLPRGRFERPHSSTRPREGHACLLEEILSRPSRQARLVLQRVRSSIQGHRPRGSVQAWC